MAKQHRAWLVTTQCIHSLHQLLLVLVVGVVVVHVCVEHNTGVLNGDLATRRRQQLEVLRERRRENAPDAVRVQLQRSTNLSSQSPPHEYKAQQETNTIP